MTDTSEAQGQALTPPFGSVERLRAEIERWRDSNRRFREEMEHQHQRAQIWEESHAGLQALFDLRYKADMRAIKMWQEAHPGNDLTWPDHADLVVWLLEQLDEERQRGIVLRDMLEQPNSGIERNLVPPITPPHD